MGFNHILGIQQVGKNYAKVISREAVRAIIKENNKILMVHCNKGDYKFPGGGIHKEENHEDALKREVQEETGYIINKIEDKIGVIIERNLDAFEKNSVFEMTSHYYLCRVTDKQTTQRLDDYEAELEFCPSWITIDEAIHKNEEVLKIDKEDKNHWVYRETLVLNQLLAYL